MKKQSELFREAKQLVLEHYVKGQFAVDAFGWAVSPTDPGAVCFCSFGALEKVQGMVGAPARLLEVAASKVLDAHTIPKSSFKNPVVVVNDDHKDLLPEMWDWAITLAELEEARSAEAA
jgi:hypothetical protein